MRRYTRRWRRSGRASAPSRSRCSFGSQRESGRCLRRPGAVLRLTGVLARRRSVRRAPARVRGILDHAARATCRTPISSRPNAVRSAMRSYTSTAELGLRVSQQVYLDAFYDAGNLWERPRDFDPTRLFRGAGFGGVARHSARSPRHRSRLWVRPRGLSTGTRIPSGKSTSSSVRSSNRSSNAFHVPRD